MHDYFPSVSLSFRMFLGVPQHINIPALRPALRKSSVFDCCSSILTRSLRFVGKFALSPPTSQKLSKHARNSLSKLPKVIPACPQLIPHCLHPTLQTRPANLPNVHIAMSHLMCACVRAGVRVCMCVIVCVSMGGTNSKTFGPFGLSSP